MNGSPRHGSSHVLGLDRRIVLAVALALGGCGTSEPSSPDAVPATPTDVEACNAPVAAAPAQAPGPNDGVYALDRPLGLGESPGIHRFCGVSDTGESFSLYVSLHRGRATYYSRSYATADDCRLASLDDGGRVEVTKAITWRACGATHVTADGTFRQTAEEAPLSGDPVPSYRFIGVGPDDPRWDELIVSTVSSTSPFDAVPSDLRFARYRR